MPTKKIGSFPLFPQCQERKVMNEVMYGRVESQWNEGRVIIDTPMGNIPLQTLQRCRKDQWLNDELVNMYTDMLQQRCVEFNRPILLLNSFFYSKLTGEQNDTFQYKQVQRWTRSELVCHFFFFFVKVKVKIIFPIHLKGKLHWACGVINLRDRQIEYYDSLFHPKNSKPDFQHFAKCMKLYLFQEWEDKQLDTRASKHALELVTLIQNMDTCVMSAPRQSNGYDCGVFVCNFMYWIAHGFFPNFSSDPSSIQYFREKICLEILLGRVL
ncbi:ULP1 like chllamydin domain containing protease [Reticulomyxa filosa]|uniref:ULP1 like chllamydin domain containing protease n=1 Tax=Reticulomyxa filosa TaxID=46433 RepID=X6N2A2_RETFI|nr:ULP1 like chllamydin domain containing protease [Reticulomyxa filosa]|eukprot:ETO20226.1 ULP1 like chllamydin domain containing protease [Reticulomyxa filosa]